MTDVFRLAAASNTRAPALAVLHRLGYDVTRIASEFGGEHWLQARRGNSTLIADDTLSLLGLTSIEEHRGKNWQPTNAEVDALLTLIDET